MRFISISDLMGPDWRFLEPLSTDPSITWSTHSGLPRTPLERRIRRPALARYRAAFEAAREARNAPGSVLVSHLPLAAAATNLARRMICPQVPQVAFAFNLTDLPTGARRLYLARALQGIDKFVVFSRFERTLYADIFRLPAERIHFLPWAMGTPVLGRDNPAAGLGRYLCAVGGEGRDYALLIQVMRSLPDIRMAIVARPHSLAGLEVPDNITVFTNLPVEQTWPLPPPVLE